MKRTVTMMVRETKGRFVQPEYFDNKRTRLKPLKPGQSQFYLSYGGKKYGVGPDPLLAMDALRAQEKVYRDIESGVAPEPTPVSKRRSLVDEAAKFLEQQKTFVGKDGYGAAETSVNAYRLRMDFYLRFCKEEGVADVRVGDYDHLLEYVGWLRQQKKANGETFSDRYVANIFSTLGTFALGLGITTPNERVVPKLGYANKEIKAHTEEELKLLFGIMAPDEELLYKFFLWSLGRDQEVGNTELGDLDFVNNTVHICPKRHRQFRLKSKRNRRGNTGDRYVTLPPSLMAKLKEFVERKGLKEGDLLFPAPHDKSKVAGHYLRPLQRMAKEAGLKFHVELHKLRKSGATLHYDGGKGVPLAEISQWLGHSSLKQTEEYLDIKSTASSQPHIQQMIANGRMAAFA
jgi:integrase